MNMQQILFGIILAILLVKSSHAAPVNETETNVTIDSNTTSQVTTLITTMNTPTSAPITTARVTTDQGITSALLSTVSSGTNSSTSITTAATATSTSSSTSTKATSTATKASGRKFDGLSFIGGMILAIGLAGIIFLIVSYLRRSNRLPYSNLR